MSRFVHFWSPAFLGAALALTSGAGLAKTHDAYFMVFVQVLPRCAITQVEAASLNRRWLIMNCTKNVGYTISLDTDTHFQTSHYEVNGFSNGGKRRISLNPRIAAVQHRHPVETAHRSLLTINY